MSPSARPTSPFSCITLSIVATVVVATGRLRRSPAQTCLSSEGPASQSTLRISSSPSVGCTLGGLAMIAVPLRNVPGTSPGYDPLFLTN